MAALTDYTSLITSEHRGAARFMATVAAVMQPFVDLNNLMASFSDAYDLDQAVGVQLDAVGLWVGVSRYVSLPIAAYFSWDTPGLGWDQGIWFQTGDATAQVTTLDDGHYRLLIRAKIACNSWDGSLPAAQAILAALVAPDGATVSGSEGPLSVTWTIVGVVSTVTQAILMGGYVPLKPIGVAITYQFIQAGASQGMWDATGFDASSWGG